MRCKLWQSSQPIIVRTPIIDVWGDVEMSEEESWDCKTFSVCSLALITAMKLWKDWTNWNVSIWGVAPAPIPVHVPSQSDQNWVNQLKVSSNSISLLGFLLRTKLTCYFCFFQPKLRTQSGQIGTWFLSLNISPSIIDDRNYWIFIEKWLYIFNINNTMQLVKPSSRDERHRRVETDNDAVQWTQQSIPWSTRLQGTEVKKSSSQKPQTSHQSELDQ